jgi:hypothetical protein
LTDYKKSIFACNIILKELQQNAPNKFLSYIQEKEEKFDIILNLIQPFRKNTVMRDAVSAEERLMATLRYLATE